MRRRRSTAGRRPSHGGGQSSPVALADRGHRRPSPTPSGRPSPPAASTRPSRSTWSGRPTGARRLVVERGPGHGQEGRSEPPGAGRRLVAASRPIPPPTWSRSRSPARASSTSAWPTRWLHDVLADVVDRGRRRLRPARPRRGHARSTSSSSAPTPPARSTPATAGARPTATRSPGCSSARLRRHAGSTTSTTAARRCSSSPPRWSARKAGEAPPEDGYQGEYITEWAAEMPDDADPLEWGDGAGLRGPPRRPSPAWTSHFDTWFSERSLVDSGAIERDPGRPAAQRRRLRGTTAPCGCGRTDYGDDKDRVLVKTDGEFTYLLPDIAYHRDKFARGFDLLIDVWGADHHGYVPRHEGRPSQALGHDPDELEVAVTQLVNLLQDGEPVRLSKRTGDIIELRDVLDEVGPDAARLTYLLQSIDSPQTFDLDVVTSQAMENPVFYVQMAHARIRSIERVAAERGRRAGAARRRRPRPAHPRAGARGAAVAVRAARGRRWRRRDRAPHKVTTWVRELAGAFHGFYHDCYVMGEGVEPGADPGPAVAGRGRPRSAWPSASTCSASARPSRCEPSPLPGRAAARHRRRVGDRRAACSIGGVRPARPGRRVRHAAVRLRRGPPPGPLPGGRRRLRRRRRLRDQGVPLQGHGPPRPRGGHAPRRRHRRRAATSPWPPACPPTGWCCTATTSPTTSCARALEAGVGRIVVDSFDEIDRIEALVADGPPPRRRCWSGSRPASRPTPTSTCAPARTTPSSASACASGAAGRGRRAAAGSLGSVDLVGLHAHIGSQVFVADASSRPSRCWPRSSTPSGLPELSIGGGLGVAYVEGEDGADHHRVGRRRAGGLRRRRHRPPGSRPSPAGPSSPPPRVTLYTVGTIKDLPGIRTYVAVDGGMSDNPRPVLYGSGYETFLPRATDADRRRTPSGSSASTASRATCWCATPGPRRPRRRRRPRHAGHRRLRPLDGLQLQQGAPPAGRVRAGRRGPAGRPPRDLRRPAPPRPVAGGRPKPQRTGRPSASSRTCSGRRARCDDAAPAGVGRETEASKHRPSGRGWRRLSGTKASTRAVRPRRSITSRSSTTPSPRTASSRRPSLAEGGALPDHEPGASPSGRPAARRPCRARTTRRPGADALDGPGPRPLEGDLDDLGPCRRRRARRRPGEREVRARAGRRPRARRRGRGRAGGRGRRPAGRRWRASRSRAPRVGAHGRARRASGWRRVTRSRSRRRGRRRGRRRRGRSAWWVDRASRSSRPGWRRLGSRGGRDGDRGPLAEQVPEGRGPTGPGRSRRPRTARRGADRGVAPGRSRSRRREARCPTSREAGGGGHGGSRSGGRRPVRPAGHGGADGGLGWGDRAGPRRRRRSTRGPAAHGRDAAEAEQRHSRRRRRAGARGRSAVVGGGATGAAGSGGAPARMMPDEARLGRDGRSPRAGGCPRGRRAPASGRSRRSPGRRRSTRPTRGGASSRRTSPRCGPGTDGATWGRSSERRPARGPASRRWRCKASAGAARRGPGRPWSAARWSGRSGGRRARRGARRPGSQVSGGWRRRPAGRCGRARGRLGRPASGSRLGQRRQPGGRRSAAARRHRRRSGRRRLELGGAVMALDGPARRPDVERRAAVRRQGRRPGRHLEHLRPAAPPEPRPARPVAREVGGIGRRRARPGSRRRPACAGTGAVRCWPGCRRHRPCRPLGGEDEVDAEAAAPPGHVDQRAEEVGELGGQRGELVDHDHQPGWAGQGDVPQVGGPGGPQRRLPLAHLGSEADQQALAQAPVEVGDHAGHVGEPGAGVEGAAALVVDEDEGHARSAGWRRGQARHPRAEQLALARPGRARDERVGAVGHQVDDDGTVGADAQRRGQRAGRPGRRAEVEGRPSRTSSGQVAVARPRVAPPGAGPRRRRPPSSSPATKGRTPAGRGRPSARSARRAPSGVRTSMAVHRSVRSSARSATSRSSAGDPTTSVGRASARRRSGGG